jgi:UDP-N-acetyl-D-mannosaminouronate:lipid I N-acetyl-D-mannosaminouronosyltransferase
MINTDTVKISNVSLQRYLTKKNLIDDMYQTFQSKGYCRSIAINPEKILTALDDRLTSSIIESAEIRYVDGVGVSLLAKWKSKEVYPRIPGCEAWEYLMEESVKHQESRVYILGGTQEVNSRTCQKLVRELNVNVVGSNNGYFQDIQAQINEIIASEANIVTVALGSPKQELFIDECIKKGVKAIFMGVGGTYDVYIGNVTRAPSLFQKLGLEWFFRLCSQPTRIVRQVRLFRFIFLAFSKKI